jgi:hypothetical protein
LELSDEIAEHNQDKASVLTQQKYVEASANVGRKRKGWWEHELYGGIKTSGFESGGAKGKNRYTTTPNQPQEKRKLSQDLAFNCKRYRGTRRLSRGTANDACQTQGVATVISQPVCRDWARKKGRCGGQGSENSTTVTIRDSTGGTRPPSVCALGFRHHFKSDLEQQELEEVFKRGKERARHARGIDSMWQGKSAAGSLGTADLATPGNGHALLSDPALPTAAKVQGETGGGVGGQQSMLDDAVEWQPPRGSKSKSDRMFVEVLGRTYLPSSKPLVISCLILSFRPLSLLFVFFRTFFVHRSHSNCWCVTKTF